MIGDSLNQSLTLQEEWLDISLDSGRFIAGERVSGEVLLHLLNNEDALKIILKSTGVESVKIHSKSGQIHENSVPIYTLNTILSEISNKGKHQSVHPFSFKIPAYSPSTFHFSGESPEGASLEICVSYTIEAILLSDSETHKKKLKPLYILNRSSRQILPSKTSQSTPLSTCCLSRGFIEISFISVNSDHAACGGRKTFRVTVQSPESHRLEGALGQVVFELTVQVPGSQEFFIRKVLSRSVLSASTFPKTGEFELETEAAVGLDFEVNLQEMVFGSNPCSNQGAFFICEYHLECHARYPLACQAISASCKMQIHVNPDVPVKDSVEYPRKWTPIEHLIANLITETCNGVPYPQGTVLVSRRRRESTEKG